ncbi:hypothetical protein OFB80_28535 [Escherichia coli]|nr:hypothetical protein [Escherichia coli]
MVKLVSEVKSATLVEMVLEVLLAYLEAKEKRVKLVSEVKSATLVEMVLEVLLVL